MICRNLENMKKKVNLKKIIANFDGNVKTFIDRLLPICVKKQKKWHVP